MILVYIYIYIYIYKQICEHNKKVDWRHKSGETEFCWRYLWKFKCSLHYFLLWNMKSHYIGETSSGSYFSFLTIMKILTDNSNNFTVANHFNLPNDVIDNVKCTLLASVFISPYNSGNLKSKYFHELDRFPSGGNRYLTFLLNCL